MEGGYWPNVRRWLYIGAIACAAGVAGRQLPLNEETLLVALMALAAWGVLGLVAIGLANALARRKGRNQPE